MRLQHIFRPYYVFRPQQLARRLASAARGTPVGPTRAPTAWGATLEVDPSDHIGHAVWNNGVYDLLVSEVLWRLAAPGSTVVDVGANIGCMTSLLATRVGPRGQVIAFEPHPVIRRRLLRNVELLDGGRGAAGVRVVAAAVGDTNGTATLVTDDEFDVNNGTARLTGGDGDGTRERFDVEVVTIDSQLGALPVQVMKVDVEGHEAAVFRGARGVLGTGQVRHVVYEDHLGAESAVHDQLESHGYRVFALGWRFNGPVIGARTERLARENEAPSYLASRDAAQAEASLRARGWRVLRRG